MLSKAWRLPALKNGGEVKRVKFRGTNLWVYFVAASINSHSNKKRDCMKKMWTVAYKHIKYLQIFTEIKIIFRIELGQIESLFKSG